MWPETCSQLSLGAVPQRYTTSTKLHRQSLTGQPDVQLSVLCHAQLATPCFAMLCETMLCYALLSNTMLSRNVPCYAKLCY